ncbi:hypothetical protein CEXT_520771 [Caerostris extrusa]|uniref:Uncharacterized protein n=1 Tax=Caerostris extrusa TaxID=172846 RepID=A0AAV4NVE2_CAEEX|nr:hypothetical protein CEXT_520771 [Caerostris extrusa]
MLTKHFFPKMRQTSLSSITLPYISLRPYIRALLQSAMMELLDGWPAVNSDSYEPFRAPSLSETATITGVMVGRPEVASIFIRH